jgi:GR25 family glycosyltransferase involved in LPS biosynthesis
MACDVGAADVDDVPAGAMSSMNDTAVRAICICLPEYPEQIEKSRAHFASVGLEVEMFWGIHARNFGLATWHAYEYDHPGSGYRMGAKATGIWLSHYMLWNCMTRMPNDYFLVLESDAKLPPDFNQRFAQAMKDAPSDFGFLHVGHCCMEGHPKTHVAGDVYESKCMQCTHAYVVRRGVLSLLLATMRKIWAPIDIQMQLEVFPKLKTYAVIPRIVDQFGMDLHP